MEHMPELGSKEQMIESTKYDVAFLRTAVSKGSVTAIGEYQGALRDIRTNMHHWNISLDELGLTQEEMNQFEAFVNQKI